MKIFLAFLFAAFASAAVAQDIEILRQALTPLGQNPQGTQSVITKSKLVIPTTKEEHLLMHYIDLIAGTNPLPGTFEELEASFAAQDPEKIGFPLVNTDGEIIDANLTRWIDAQLDHSRPLNSDLYPRSRILGWDIDQSTSKVDPVTGLLSVQFASRWQFQPTEASAATTVPDFSVPANYFSLFHQIAGTEALRQSALELLKTKQLPRPRLGWQRQLQNVNHLCLGEIPQRRTLNMNAFISSFNFLDNRCYIGVDTLVTASSSVSTPQVTAVTAYPELDLLLEDNKLEVLVALQQCRTEECPADKTWPAVLTQLFSEANFSETATNDEHVRKFAGSISGTEVIVTLLQNKRPVYFQKQYWEEFKKNELIFTNRMPYDSSLIQQTVTDRYQIVVGSMVGRGIWGRIFSHEDVGLVGLDAISADLLNLPAGNVYDLIKTLAGAGSYYQSPANNWPRATDWLDLLGILQKGTNASLTANYVRTNAFQPGVVNPRTFSPTTSLDHTVALLNSENPDGVYIDRAAGVMFLTQIIADTATDFDDFLAKTKAVCQDQLTDSVRNNYFFSRGCTPQRMLASEALDVGGTHYARGSFIDLYYGSRGVPKQVLLSAVTEIQGIKFKPYYVDNGGVIKFYRSNGQVKQGHLAEETVLHGFPLLGGLGTSMVRFYEDGQLMTGQLPRNISKTIGGRLLPLRGNWQGPHQISFYPDGNVQCVYLSEDVEVNGWPLMGVPQSDARPEGSSAKRVCFHANGNIRTAMLATAKTIDGVTYPVGTRLTFDADGEVIAPILRVTASGTYFWNEEFPAGSLYQPNSDGFPEWIILNSELTYRSHRFASGSTVRFSETGGLREVTSPAGGSSRVVLQDYSITVPENATLYFNYEYPAYMTAPDTITIAGLTFGKIPVEKLATVHFHENGRLYRGFLAQDGAVQHPNYGSVNLKGQSVIEFNDDGEFRLAVLADDSKLEYEILSDEDRPDGYTGSHLPALEFAAGTAIVLDYSAKVRSARLALPWKSGVVQASPQSVVYFDDAHSIRRIDFSLEGGLIAGIPVAQGSVPFVNGVATAFTLNADYTVGGYNLPATTKLTFFANGSLKTISGRAGLILSVGTVRYTESIELDATGLVKRGFLAEDLTVGQVKLANLAKCRSLRFLSPVRTANECAVEYYDGSTQVLKGVAAEDVVVDGLTISAGQWLYFDEEGNPFLL